MLILYIIFILVLNFHFYPIYIRENWKILRLNNNLIYARWIEIIILFGGIKSGKYIRI